jgi:hypothetical protein
VLKPGGKLYQILPLDLSPLQAGETVTLSLHSFAKSNPADCASAQLKVNYGAAQEKLVIPLASAPVKQWQQASSDITLDAQPVRIKLELEAKGCVKPFRLDDVVITIAP